MTGSVQPLATGAARGLAGRQHAAQKGQGMTAAKHLRVVHEAQEVEQARTLRKRRVTVMCVPCGRMFRYIYPGTGPYRSVCPQCKGTA